MIVGFDGLNGVGKTTMAKKFAEEFNYRYMSRPIYEVLGIENQKPEENYKVATDVENRIYNNTRSSELKACLTGLGLLYVHKNMKDKNIVIDRDLISNFSYNGTRESLPLFEAFIKMGVYPDISFLLYANNEELVKRIKNRNPEDTDLTDKDVILQSYNKIMKFIKIYNLPTILIDTNNKSEQQVFEEIRSKYMEVLRENGDIESGWEH